MKKILLTLVAFMVTVALNAEQVSKQQALLKAQQFMPGKHFGDAKAFARGKSASPAEYEVFYIFNAEGKKGFVIVSGDDRTEPILGYSDRGSLNVDSVPENVKGLLNYYEKVLTAIANDKSYTRPAKTRSGEERATVEPLLWTEWGQGSPNNSSRPFNLKCPVVDGRQCVTGCVATAMAQIMNYHQWPKEKTSSVPSYTTEKKKIYLPQLEPIKFPWGFLRKDDIANLMLYCGQSVQMEYGYVESAASTSLVPDALKNIFHYSDKAQFISKDDYSEKEWEDIIYKEVLEKRPVLYSGFPSGGGDGHAFIIDGYESGRFHVDWGWDGSYNGHFLLTYLYVDCYMDYRYFPDAVIGIQPPEGKITNAIRPKAIVQNVAHYPLTKYLWRQDDGKFPAFSITTWVYGADSKKETLQLGWGLCGENGLISVLAYDQQEIGSDWSDSFYHESSIIIDGNLADGNYTIIPVHRSNDSDPWVADIPNISGLGFLNNFYTDICIKDNLMRFVINFDGDTCLEEDKEHISIQTIDGVTYDLWKYSEELRATVIPSTSGNYSGNVFIPDKVTYDGKQYMVYNADLMAFSDCPELTSLSTAMYDGPRIYNCPNLTKLELREGVTHFQYDNSIMYNASLESIDFPQSLLILTSGSCFSGCDKLKTMRFLGKDQMVFHLPPLESLKDVYFFSVAPPRIEWYYENPELDVTIHIPVGALSAYSNSKWADYKLSDDINIEPSNQISWGYCLDNERSEHMLGVDCIGIRETAIHVPTEMLEVYKNKKITGIEFWLEGFGFEWPDYIFVTTPGVEHLVKQPVTDKAGFQGWNRISFSEPYTITGDELFVGLGREEELAVRFSTMDITEPDGCWGRQLNGGDDMDGVWKNIYDYQPELCHPLTLRFIIEGEDLPKDVRVCYPTINNGKIEMAIVNRCTDVLTSYTVKWDLDGKINGTKTVETCLASGLADVLTIDIPSDFKGYQHTFTLDVISVNGEDDAVPANSHVVYDFKSSADTHYPRTMVMENFVATWCGWSPRGYAAIEKLYDKYPNNFISIGIHEKDDFGDPINYETLINKYTSTPTFLFNRTNYIDSTLEDATATMEEQKDNADAMISANAVFATEDKTSVTVKTATTFGFTDDGNADFRIAYVVVEDKVGPYLQGNNYSNPSAEDNPEDYMNEWYKKDYQVEMKFIDVARGIYPNLNGTEGSVPTSVVAGQPYEYEYTFDLPDNIQDKKNIRIVTLLIDNKSGEIMNADQTKVITETDMDGDANNDNEVDNKDVDVVIRYIMYGDIKGFNFKNADVNGDNKINAADIVEVVNIIKPNK